MVERLCKEFLEKIGDEARAFEFTPKLKKGLSIPDDAVVYLAHDDTMFHSGKDGFAITDQGVYCKLMSESLVVTSMDELKDAKDLEWGEDGGDVLYADGAPLVYYSDGKAEVEDELMELFEGIISALSGKEFSPAPVEDDNSDTAEDSEAASDEQSSEEQSSDEQSSGGQVSGGDVSVSGGGNIGYNSVSNVQGFTNGDLLEKLSAVRVSFGTPIMGDINGTPSVMYKNVTEDFDVFCRINGDNVIMGKIGADGVSSVQTAVSAGIDMFLGVRDESSSTANRAVDELCSVIEKLERGEEVTDSGVSGLDEAVTLYMVQKAISIKPKFDIFDKDENPVYHIEGDLTRLNFSIQRNGETVLKLKKKLVAIMPEYTIERTGVEIAKIKKKFKLTNPELNGQINGQEMQIRGDLFGFDFDIVVGGTVIGHVDKDYGFWADHYRIRSFEPQMQDIVIALAIICDNVADKEESN